MLVTPRGVPPPFLGEPPALAPAPPQLGANHAHLPHTQHDTLGLGLGQVSGLFNNPEGRVKLSWRCSSTRKLSSGDQDCMPPPASPAEVGAA